MSTTYRYNAAAKEWLAVDKVPEEAAAAARTHFLVRPDVNFVSSALCRWDKDHAAGGGQFTDEGKPVFTSRREAMDYSARSAGEHDTYNTWGDIDGL